jgi:hypothetical protein
MHQGFHLFAPNLLLILYVHQLFQKIFRGCIPGPLKKGVKEEGGRGDMGKARDKEEEKWE